LNHPFEKSLVQGLLSMLDKKRKTNKRPVPNKDVQGGFFFQKILGVHGRLLGTIEYFDY